MKLFKWWWKWRRLSKLYARVLGYFWLPCPICKKYFGGHEWLPGNDLNDLNGSGRGQGVCPRCGPEARRLNEAK